MKRLDTNLISSSISTNKSFHSDGQFRKIMYSNDSAHFIEISLFNDFIQSIYSIIILVNLLSYITIQIQRHQHRNNKAFSLGRIISKTIIISFSLKIDIQNKFSS